MPKAIKISPMLNHDRLRIIRKGHANVSDLQKFIPASRRKAELEFQVMAREILLSEGKAKSTKPVSRRRWRNEENGWN